MIITINSIGVWGSGLNGWDATQAILRGEQPRVDDTRKLPPPSLLPPNERRRASQVIRLALLCAQEACQNGPYEASELPALFASSNGDGFIINRILDALASPMGAVSPSMFHNSVHNAPAGYWMIAHHCQQPAVSLGFHNETVAAALLKAATEASSEETPLLFCAYDAPIPGSLGTVRRTDQPFGCAFVLTPGAHAGPQLSLSLHNEVTETDPAIQLPVTLQDMARYNPAGRLLPLLHAIAHHENHTLHLPYGQHTLTVELTHA